MSTTTTFEDEVRAMLARRAADIDPAALDPRPRDGVRIALVDERPGHRGPVRWLTAAAVVAVLAAGALVLRDGPDGHTATVPASTTDAAGTAAPGGSSSTAVIPGLPAGIGVAHLLPLWDAGAAAADLEPVEVADRYLADRIGVTATALATTIPPTDEGLVTVTWGDGAGWTTPLGSVHLERRDGRWQVIAATAPDTFDLAGARLADGRLQGVVANRSTLRWGAEIGPADLTAPVQGLAGLVLGMPSDCASPCEQETGVYIAMPDLAAAGGSTVPVELAPIGEPLAPVPHRLQAVAVRPDVGLTGGEDPQVSAPAAATFTEIVFDPTVPPVEPGSDTAPALPEHLASLPLGIDPTVGPVRTIEAWGAVPEAAAEDLAVEAFGGLDRVTAFTPLDIEGADPDGLWAAHYASVVPLDPAAWPGEHADGVRGTVIVRRTDTGWTAVAATSDALDLTGVRYDAADGGLRGEVRAAVPAPLRVTVSTLTGEVLATSDLTTSGGSQGPSVLGLDDVLETTDGQPVLLRVTVGDRPGQVGLDGVGVAAFASVVLPGWSDDGGGIPTTTTG